ncbi:hypothetical protein M408DRAFT_327688 [Serendipita vermifera MAFF 305830]|uniref:Serine aminopeptidase S33 domain-containing protein n=1 Tax=Serendipita vermifera MAFF 305830 TaxID=933852 RepID=A0A0C3BH43_SERVB|nr:hypothetical protein M408DRAFT_327688 [Serendipita vermifera MAFF 305830]
MSDSTPVPYTDEWVTGSGGIKLFARLQAPSHVKGAVVFVHGFIEHLARYDLVRESLCDKGFAVLFYDQRGFGQSALNVKSRSTGSSYGKNTRPELLDDVQCMLHLARERFKTDNLYLYGHSMGGSIVLQYTCIGKDDLKVKQYLRGVVSTSPLIRQRNPAAAMKLTLGHIAQTVLPWVMIPAPVEAKALCHDEEIQKAYLADPLVIQKGTLRGIDSMLRSGVQVAEHDYQSWPESIPVFLIHGTDDQVTSPQATQQFHDGIKATDKKIELISGGFHELHNEPEFKFKLLSDITTWLNEHVPKAGAVAHHETHAPADSVTEAPAGAKL